MNARKTISIITASALMMGTLSGCSLLGGKDKEAVTETLTKYLEAISKSKFNNSQKYVVDSEDYFFEHEFDGQTSGVLEAMFAETEFEITEVEVNKNSATAEVEFTIPDIEALAEEGYSYDEFIDAIADADKTTETLEFELSKEDDEWLIEPDSTEDYFNFLMDLAGDLELSALSEASAMQAVDAFIALLAAGNVSEAAAMSSNFTNEVEDFEEALSVDNLELMGDVMAAYFSHLDYELEVTDSTEDSITVTVTGSAPDAETAVNAASHDTTLLAPVAADYIEATLNGNVDMEMLMGELFDVVVNAIDNANIIPYSSFAVVTCDEYGNLMVEPDSEFMQTFDFPGFAEGEEVVPAALDLLLEQGRITQEQYNQFSGIDTGSTGSSDYDVTDIVVSEGDDFYAYNVFVSANAVEVHVQTWDYYNTGDVFNYDVSVNGSSAILTGDYEISTNNTDIVEIVIPVDPSEGPYGNYQITVYDEGSNTTSVLCQLEVIVLEQGAPTTGDVGFGTSMTFDEVSNDFYTFRFLDGNGRSFNDSVYPSNRGAVNFYAMTWAYYDAGSVMNCDVYLNGHRVDSISSVSENDSNDTFEFEYEPSGGLENGNYTFVLYDVDDSSVFAYAYATVDDVD